MVALTWPSLKEANSAITREIPAQPRSPTLPSIPGNRSLVGGVVGVTLNAHARSGPLAIGARVSSQSVARRARGLISASALVPRGIGSGLLWLSAKPIRGAIDGWAGHRALQSAVSTPTVPTFVIRGWSTRYRRDQSIA